MEREIDRILTNARLTHPRWRWEPALDPTLEQFYGIRALTYDGLTTEKGKTLVFAYIGFPENAAPGRRVPGVVLVHGGGGHPYLPWVKMWNARGYAAIAMDTTGYFPTSANAGSLETDTAPYIHGLQGAFARSGYAEAPGRDDMKNDTAPITAQWMTHAVAQVLLAHSVLREFPAVDRARIGVTGISWGGVLSSVALTHDPRFAFAVPIYGSGYLDRALTYFGPILQRPGNIANFRAEDGFPGVRMPILWLAWDDDNNFTVTSNSLSYLATVPHNEKTMLVLAHGMGHSHVDGWRPSIIMAYADWIVRGGPAPVTFATQPAGRNARAVLRIPDGIGTVDAALYWIDAPMTYSAHDKFGMNRTDLTYMDQVWQIAPAKVENGVLTAVLPERARGYYLSAEFTLGGERLTVTSAYTAVG